MVVVVDANGVAQAVNFILTCCVWTVIATVGLGLLYWWGQMSERQDQRTAAKHAARAARKAAKRQAIGSI